VAILVDMTSLHVPVLAGELVDVLDPQPGQTAIDCTVGGGGHARVIAERLGPSGTLIGIDRDPVAEERFAELAAEVSCQTRFLRTSFVDGLAELIDEGVRADLVYLDLGVSSMQVDTAERGFSYAYDAPLDMRMDPIGTALTANEIVNTWDARRLARLLRTYGEERYATPIARAIVRTRHDAEIETTQTLVDVIKGAIPAPARFAGGHPAKRTFQALRIAVNDELGQLDAALPLAWEVLAPHGRLAAISFHSLEDRRVKRFLADRARGCICPPDLPVCACGREPEAELLTRKSIAPTPARSKPTRARSPRACARREGFNGRPHRGTASRSAATADRAARSAAGLRPGEEEAARAVDAARARARAARPPPGRSPRPRARLDPAHRLPAHRHRRHAGLDAQAQRWDRHQRREDLDPRAH